MRKILRIMIHMQSCSISQHDNASCERLQKVASGLWFHSRTRTASNFSRSWISGRCTPQSMDRHALPGAFPEDGPDILDRVHFVGFCWPGHGNDVQSKPFSGFSGDVCRGVILLKMEVVTVQIFGCEILDWWNDAIFEDGDVIFWADVRDFSLNNYFNKIIFWRIVYI